MFPFHFKKAVQAVAHLLRTEPSWRMNYMRLLKLLYIADRESIKETGEPITGDRAFAMERGPVLTRLYDLIMERDKNSPEWNRFFQKVHYDLEMTQDPGMADLCRYEADKLREIAERYADEDEIALVQRVHQFEEWKKYAPREGASRPIPFREILEAVDRLEDKESIESDAREHAFARRVLEDPES